MLPYKNKTLLYELWDFIRTPTIWIKDKFSLYINWMKMPYYTNSNIPINLILLFLIIQILYLLILKFFDWIYEVRYGADNWKKIQNN